MKLLLLVVLLSYGNVTFSKECAPKLKKSDLSLTSYISCPEKSKKCLVIRDQEGVAQPLLESSKLYIGVSSLKITQDSSKRLSLNLKMDNDTSCLFGKMTKENIGKKMALVLKGEMILFANIKEEISGGVVLISLPKKNKKSALEMCREIDKNCKFEVAKESELEKMLSPSLDNIEETIKKYKKVKESYQWYTNKKKLTVLKLREGTLVGQDHFPLSTGSSPSSKKINFLGIQEYNKDKKIFIYTDDLIYIRDKGWFARKDIIPGNVIASNENLTGAISLYYVI
ncbi:MAG: hypothetical protein ACJAT2_003647, partial [Bacteriovoracaceae bacterium]